MQHGTKRPSSPRSRPWGARNLLRAKDSRSAGGDRCLGRPQLAVMRLPLRSDAISLDAQRASLPRFAPRSTKAPRWSPRSVRANPVRGVPGPTRRVLRSGRSTSTTDSWTGPRGCPRAGTYRPREPRLPWDIHADRTMISTDESEQVDPRRRGEIGTGQQHDVPAVTLWGSKTRFRSD